MNVKKTKKADLERRRSMFFQIGFIMALGAVLVAFEWESSKGKLDALASNDEITELDLPPIVRLEEPKVEKITPPKIAIEEIIIVDNDEVIDDDLEIISEVTDETTVDYEKYDLEEESTDPVPFFSLADKPEFPGGNNALLSYLGKSVKYPVIAQENGIQGTVYLSFIISEKGKVTDVSVLRGVDPSLDKEAVRVVSLMPDWKPGKQGTKAVKVSYQVPIRFTLQ